MRSILSYDEPYLIKHTQPSDRLLQSQQWQKTPPPHPDVHRRSNRGKREVLLPGPERHSHTWPPDPDPECCGCCTLVRSAVGHKLWDGLPKRFWLWEVFYTLSLVPTPSVPDTRIGSTKPAAFKSKSPANPPSSALQPQTHQKEMRVFAGHIQRHRFHWI